LKLVLYTGLEVVRISAVLLSPIMPKKCAQILAYLGERRPLDGSVPFEELAGWGGLKSGHVIGDVPRLFPRIDEKKLKEVLESVEASKGVEEKAGSGDMEPIRDEVTIDDFSRVDLRVGIIREGHHVEGSKKLLRLMVDIGEGRLRQIFAGIKSHYAQPRDLVGAKVIVVANLKPRKMKFGISEGMVLAAGGGGDDRLCIAEFDGDIEPGDTVT